jgi:hypothetical protein
MNGFPLTLWLNCNNQSKSDQKRLFPGHKRFLQSKPIHLKEVFQREYQRNLRPVDCCGIGSTVVFVKTNKGRMAEVIKQQKPTVTGEKVSFRNKNSRPKNKV